MIQPKKEDDWTDWEWDPSVANEMTNQGSDPVIPLIYEMDSDSDDIGIQDPIILSPILMPTQILSYEESSSDYDSESESGNQYHNNMRTTLSAPVVLPITEMNNNNNLRTSQSEPIIPSFDMEYKLKNNSFIKIPLPRPTPRRFVRTPRF